MKAASIAAAELGKKAEEWLAVAQEKGAELGHQARQTFDKVKQGGTGRAVAGPRHRL